MTWILAIGAAAIAGPVEPFNYLELADSPWLDQPGFAVTDCEEGFFDLLGVTPSTGGVAGPSNITDSVDGDDGAIDGCGADGYSFFSGNGNIGITFTLDPDLIGYAPTRVGLVWTDGFNLITFEAFDLDGNSLGITNATFGDADFACGTSEDHFFGYEHEDGIGAIKISNFVGGIEVDHIQYAGGEPVCEADCNGDGNLNILDFVCFQSEWQAQSPAGDCDANGQYNILDFVCFQGLFQDGCP